MEPVEMETVEIPQCSLPANYNEPVEVTIEEGGKLELKVPAATNIWHREFADGRREYVERPSEYLEVGNVWRGGDMGSDHSPIKVEVGKDGTLTMPEVTAADSAQYFTYYFMQGMHHYEYFNVKIGN